jgi:ectoine hydroxylase-related dioxygenase (phytanoyl-CoA dioxygenase family)
MSLIHLPNTVSASKVVQCLREHGYAIIDKLVPGTAMDRIAEELEPYTSVTPFGPDSILGRRTKRTGGLIARSVEVRELILNPTIIETARRFLSHATTFQIHCTQIVSIHPGAEAQTLHQDEVAWDMFPFPNDYHVQCNTLWAMTDYSEKMGATRIIPGSHRAGRSVEFEIEASFPAEMEKGSVLIYDGKVYHGGGANCSDQVGYQPDLCARLAAAGGEPVFVLPTRNCPYAARRIAASYGLSVRSICLGIRPWVRGSNDGVGTG